MKEDPSTAWRWNKASRYRLKKGDRVFVSISSGTELAYSSGVYRTLIDAGLVPLVYRNLTIPRGGMTSNILREAMLDFYTCQALFIVLSRAEEIQAADDWTASGMASAIRRGVVVCLYLTAAPRTEAALSTSSVFPNEVIVAQTRNGEELVNKLRSDLAGLGITGE